MDTYVFSGILIVVVTCALFGYAVKFAINHIKKDAKDHPGE
jgi:hypothetical protein